MSDPFDIQSAVEAFLNADDLVEARGLAPDRSRFDASDGNGLFNGDVPGGVTLAGKGAFLVQGSLNGDPGNPCTIDVAGEVIVTGEVRHARIHCRSLRIGGAVHHSHLSVAENIVSGAELSHTRLVLGDYASTRNRIDALRRDLVRLRREWNAFNRDIEQNERKLERAARSTRSPIDFTVGRFIRHEDGRIRIDLCGFFQSMEKKQTEEKFGTALTEFFAKGIIGYLVRTNCRYIQGNPARKKIFLQLLKNLRELVFLVFERDCRIREADRREGEIGRLIDEIRQRCSTLHVKGGLLPGTEVRFELPRVQRLEDGEVRFLSQAASLSILEGEEDGGLRIETTDADGEKEVQKLNPADLQSILLRSHRGKIRWESVRETAA